MKTIIFLVIPILALLFAAKWIYGNWKRSNKTLDLDRKAEELRRYQDDKEQAEWIRLQTFKKLRK